jgi:chaperone modulatory protein CbpM
MITIEALCLRVGNVTVADIERWIDVAWLRPEGEPGQYVFHDIDVARARLIAELTTDLGIGRDGMPLVLSLLDQLYDARRQMIRLRAALDRPQVGDVRARVHALLADLPK